MKKVNIDRLDILSFLNGLVFYAPVALLVRTNAGVTTAQFFVLQAILSLTVFLFEIPTGIITDKLGYKNTMILAQITLFLAKVLLFAAFMQGSYALFVIEAVVEGFAACFLSGTQDAYIYSVYKSERYAVKMARVSNFGTAGFIVSTLLYVVFYHFGGIQMLIIATMIACGAGIPCVAGIDREPAVRKTQAAAEGGAADQGSGAGMMTIFADVRMIFMVLLAAGFSLGFLLINFFYVDKLLMCGLQEELMSVIIIVYSVVQMAAEKILDRIDSAHDRIAMLVCVVFSGIAMMMFAFAQTTAVVVGIMVILPLLLSVPEFLLDGMENAYIDRYGQEEKRAAILSVANMVGNLIEIVFLFASAYIVRIGISACFMGAGLMLIVFGVNVFLFYDGQQR